jgi:hypothetical protein
VECNTLLKSSQGELQVFFRPHPDLRFKQRVMPSQSHASSNWDSFGTPPWESQNKKPFRCGCRREAQSILYGRRWRFPLSLGLGESCESKVARACPSTKGAPESDLTNLLVGLIQVRVSN